MSDELHVLDLLPAYVLNSLEADEVRRVEEHLSTCLICRNESSAFQATAAQLSFAAPAAMPSPDLKDRLMQRVRATRPPTRVPVQPSARSWLERLLPAWSLASLVFIFVLAGFNVLLWQRMNHFEAVSLAGRMQAVPLVASTSASQATGFVVISADGDSGALVVDGLPPLGEQKQYRLWLLRDGERTSGAVFSTDEKNYGGTRIRAPRSLLDYSAVDITIEPTGGSSQPTGEKVLGGPLPRP
jgi:anti-sigma-K factor RskA